MKCTNCDNEADYELRRISEWIDEYFCEECFIAEHCSGEGADLYKQALEVVEKEGPVRVTRGNPKACSVCGSDNVVHTTTLLGVTLRYCQEHYDYFVRGSK